MTKYNKLPLLFEEQVKLLRDRGLTIDDDKRTIKHLSNISYYRLSAYMLPFKKINEDAEYIDDFQSGSSWEKIYRLYLFDRKLRLLVFDNVERIEIAIRTQIIYQLSNKYGSHWQDNRTIFKDARTITKEDDSKIIIDVFNEVRKHIMKQLKDNKSEVFIKHYVSKYNEPITPPSWMSVEVMYFSHLSKICDGLRNRQDIVGIGNYFNLPPDVFCSWLHSMNYVRNLCAHHSRLWNRDLRVVPMKLDFSKNLTWISNPKTAQRSKTYYFLCMINYLLQTIIPDNKSFKSRLINLLNEYSDVVNVGYMGFPADWRTEDMWNIKQ